MSNIRGIIRRMDELGRVVIPMEVRRELGIGPHDRMEIIPVEGGITMRKCDTGGSIRQAYDALERLLSEEVSAEDAPETLAALDTLEEIIERTVGNCEQA